MQNFDILQVATLNIMNTERRKFSLPKRRKSSAISYEKYMAINGNAGTRIRKKSAHELQNEIDKSVQMRRKYSTAMNMSNSHETFYEQNEIDKRDKYLTILKEMQSTDDEEDLIARKHRRLNSNSKLKCEKEVKTNQFASLLRYMTSEHDTLLQILVFLPLILAAFYIAVIEQQPLLRYRK